MSSPQIRPTRKIPPTLNQDIESKIQLSALTDNILPITLLSGFHLLSSDPPLSFRWKSRGGGRGLTCPKIPHGGLAYLFSGPKGPKSVIKAPF